MAASLAKRPLAHALQKYGVLRNTWAINSAKTSSVFSLHTAPSSHHFTPQRLPQELWKASLISGSEGPPRHSGLSVESGRGFATVRSNHSCWKCGRMLNGDREQFFCDCGIIQPASSERTLFEIMDLPTDFDIDVKKLQERYRQLQQSLHPDRFTLKTNTEKTYSAEQSAMLNRAMNTLQKPLTRGLYMLELYSLTLQEDEITMEPEFLADMMDLNEQVMEAGSASQLAQLQQANDAVLNKLFVQLSIAFKQKQLPQAKMILSTAKYYSSVEEKIKERQQQLLAQ